MPNRLNVMLIEDDQEVLESLDFTLDSLGFRTAAFLDPREAIRAYFRNHYDLVITDLKMPQLDGLGVLCALRGGDPQARVIIISGALESGSREKARQAGAVCFLRKPLLDIEAFVDLLAGIEQAVNQAAEA